MDKEIKFVFNKAKRVDTQTEFLKSIQHNDHYGCITLQNGNKYYPELDDNTTVTMFLKNLYKQFKSGKIILSDPVMK